MAEEYTIEQIAELSPANVRTVKKRLRLNGIQPVRVEKRGSRQISYYGPEAIEAVRGGAKAKPGSEEAVIDPETGLPWQVAEIREKTLKNRHERVLAEKRLRGEWLPVSVVQEILSEGAGHLERLPGKLRSELGLSDHQANGLRRALDEIRTAWAAKVGGMDADLNLDENQPMNRET